MPFPPDKALTPEAQELARKQRALAALEAQLADRELELATLRADLDHFERHYLQTVGRRYARLDDLKAQITEARARRQPQQEDVREQAQEARAKAQESAQAAGAGNAETPALEDETSPPKPQRSESLRNLYREAAKLLHPDLTLDGEEKKKRDRLMAEINDAYKRGDEERIRAILREWHASPENVQGDGPGAELVRIIRKIAQVEQRLENIAAELEQLRQGELFKLKQQVEEARENGRDVLGGFTEVTDWENQRGTDDWKR